MAVDLGSRRIGLAIAETPELPAMPLKTIEHVSRLRDVATVAEIARQRGAAVIVVGYPLRLDGTPGRAAEAVDAFVERLRTVFDGEVVTVDERMTTAAATSKLRADDRFGKRARSMVDRLAAAEILSSYLAAQRRRGT